MRLSAGGASVTGPAHLQNGLPNQDALSISGLRGGWSIAVADGLGSRPLSHIGSRKAVHLIRHLAQRGQNLQHSNIAQWLCRDWLAHFGDEYQAYETTCLWAWVDAKGHGVAGQIGDGLVLIKSQGIFNVLSGVRAGFGNQTATLAQAAPSECRSQRIELTQSGDGVLMMTDGIADDLVPESLESFFDVIYQRQLRSNKRQMRTWLTKELQNWSTPQHGDDKSIAGFFRMD
ncbi:hypothetical protein XBJ2_730005 [Xenorhabdus bovienii str. Jollieti]|uniref:PPM-type phosphatase domain-containing protein n=1 Tax=Xenorhabdus bovienii (strain SS-2004) TaxID=406818 RepID=D3V062_XENBS|nr:PP2C family serine/threonine-protein phosphatase [Xenorhabdus bovienii]CBJ80614.1 hypothetical protein XBJ1_1485 [Xenorhabdus bovienii SS-2004]CDH30323.1 hypothetical protein XBJ2_730005 [Xenorhabdus bovienii str. Jollieti]